MSNQEIIITIGISGSGKSTWSSNYIKENLNYIRVNRDDIRKQITGSNQLLLNNELESLVTKIQDEQIRVILSEGYNIILDATHLKQKYINQIIKQFNYFANIRLKIFDCDVNVAKERVSERDNKPIESLGYIEKQRYNYKNLNLNNLEYPKIEVKSYEYSNDLPSCIICDLDGTLSLYFSDKSPYNRDFENDDINIALRNILLQYNHNHLFFFSGRNGKFKDQTIQFLDRCGFSDKYYTLIMRDEKDMRRDSEVKLQMFDENIRGKYNVNCVFDDRLQVIEEVWNLLGVFVFNCNQGNKRF